jgi:7-keto-8-aminopelargonate synthetase-like enzyme
MFTVIVNDSTLKVGFAHHRNLKAKPVTICTITGGKDVVSSGAARCADHDNFCRATGRKLALTRALAKFDKAARSVVWAKYWATATAATPKEAKAA